MLKNIQKFNKLIPLETSLQAKYSTMTFGKIKKNSVAAQKLNTDGNNSHVKGFTNKCNTEKCGEKKCATLCGPLKTIEADGHFTQDPIVGKFSRFISEHDVKGNHDKQYYTTNSDKEKKIDATEVKTGWKRSIDEILFILIIH